jgi:hypothetical protein
VRASSVSIDESGEESPYYRSRRRRHTTRPRLDHRIHLGAPAGRRAQPTAINATRVAKTIPDAIAIPHNGSPKIENSDFRASSLAATSARTAGETAAMTFAGGFFRGAGERGAVVTRELMIDVLLAR